MESSAGTGNQTEEVVNEVLEVGNALLSPPSSRDALLDLLHKAEIVLTWISQDPSQSTAKALFPMMNALISKEIFKHSDGDIQVVVAACLNELTRITAPEYSYSDELMQDIFKLFMIALKQLPCGTDKHFIRAHRILNTMAKIRTCVMMWDLELDELVAEMFQIFFNTIKLRPNRDLLESMETILVMMINDSDDISLKLLTPLLESVKIDTKTASLASWKLGEIIFRKCATKIKPHLKEAWKKLNLNFIDYAEIIRTLCGDTSRYENLADVENLETDLPVIDGLSGESLTSLNANSNAREEKHSPEVNDEHETSMKAFNCAQNIVELKSRIDQSDLDTVSQQRRRGRRPNSLVRPEEGYEQPWTIGRGRPKRECLDGSNRGSAFSKKKVNSENPSPKLGECCETSTAVKPGSSVGEESSKNSSQRKMKPSAFDPVANDCPLDSVPDKEKKAKISDDDNIGENLVKTRIMVWWPLDKTFYTGTVESFDPETKKHKIIYDDDEEEHLDLKNERWEVFVEGRPRQILEADSPPATKVRDETESKRMKRKPSSNQDVARTSKRLKAELHSHVKTRVSVN